MFPVVVISILASAVALPNPENAEPSVETVARVMGKDCINGLFSATCVKIGAISMLEKLNNKDEVALLPGVSLVKDGENSGKAEAVAAELARSMPAKPEERLDKFLLYRLGTFLDTHSVKLRLLDDDAAEEARHMIGEARGKDPLGLSGGKKGGMGGLMALGMMMKGTMMSLGMGGLAMLAGKALMTAMMSLLLSAIIGIKSLSGGKSTTYEVIAKPVYSHSHTHSSAHEDVGGGYGHSGYGRNLNVKRR